MCGFVSRNIVIRDFVILSMGHNWRDKRLLHPSYIYRISVKNLIIKMHTRGIIIHAWRSKKKKV